MALFGLRERLLRRLSNERPRDRGSPNAEATESGLTSVVSPFAASDRAVHATIAEQVEGQRPGTHVGDPPISEVLLSAQGERAVTYTWNYATERPELRTLYEKSKDLN